MSELVPAAPRPTPFSIVHRAGGCAARAGRLQTAHGVVDTPAFMPVATQGTIKGIDPEQLVEMSGQILLANAYHLMLRPGVEVIEAVGGLHRFMGWRGAILTDSGGYQVMSLAALRKITEDGVTFRSHLDGSQRFLTPEAVIEGQVRLGVDILMPLDECVPHGSDAATVATALRRTTAWAERSSRAAVGADRHVFGIVQGGLDAELRRVHAEQLAAIGFPGYAVGGLSVGEDREVTWDVAAATAAALPADRPRYLMGVGLPQDLLRFVGMGYDLFDCVLPTRNGRNGACFTSRGRVNLRLARHARDSEPVDPACGCPVCRRFSRAYLRHLATAGEMLGAQLATVHNLHFYLDLMRAARAHVAAGDYAAWARQQADAIEAGERA